MHPAGARGDTDFQVLDMATRECDGATVGRASAAVEQQLIAGECRR